MGIQYNQNQKADAMLTKRQLFACFTSFALIGCATPNSLREAGASARFESRNQPQAVAACIADGFENGKLPGSALPISMRPSQTGYTVTALNGLQQPAALVDVEATPAGSRTTFYRGLVIVTDAMEKSLKECQS